MDTVEETTENADGTPRLAPKSRARGEGMELDSDSHKEEGNETKPTDEMPNVGGNTEATEKMVVDEEETDEEKPNEGAKMDEAKSTADGDLLADFNAKHGAAAGEDQAEELDRFVKVTLRLPAEGSGKLGMVLQDADGGRPTIVSLGPTSPFRDVIPARVLRHFVVVGIKGEDGDEVEIESSTDLQRELVARRKKGGEAAVEVSFERREQKGAEAGSEAEEVEMIEQLKKKSKAEGEAESDSSEPAPTIKVTVRLPPVGSGKLGVVLKDDPLHRGLPMIAELKTESPFHGAIPPPLISHYCIVRIGDEENGEAAIGSSADLQRELAARRKDGGVVLSELSFERRSDESLEKERGEKKRAAEKKREKGEDGVRRSARKKKKADYREGTANPGCDAPRFAQVYLQLPPEGAGKMGLIIQDDKDQRKLPLIMAVGPDSPFLNSIPPQVVRNYWVIAVKDEFGGLSKTRSSKELQRQLAARRRKDEATLVELSFAKRGVDGDVHQQYQAMQQALMGQPSALPSPAAQQQMAMQQNLLAMQQAQMQQQLLLRQQMQQQLVAAATAPSQSTHGRPTNERLENPLAPKGKLSKASAKDETVRKALSEYFSMGEARSVNEFCHAYAKQYSAISKELGDHPRLKEIRDRRKGDEGGFTEEDVREATECLNEIYSRDYGKGPTPPEKRKRGETEKKRAKTQFPPLKPKGFCKGVQSKAVEDYYANKHCDNGYLYEHCRLSNFRGWRHKDCEFIGVLDKNQRCVKCRSAYSNLNMARTPLLFKAVSAVKTVEDSVLPKTHEIRQAVQNRMEALSSLDDVAKDPELLLVCKVMKLKSLVSVELDRGYFDLNRTMFIVCDHEDCLVPMLKKKRANNATICDQCRRTKSNNERLKKRAETHKEDRVAVGSHVPFSKLTPEEAVERYNALSFQYKKLVQKCNKLEGKRADARQELFAAERRAKGAEFRAPLLPWPFYLNYNPVVAEEYSVPIPEVPAPPSPRKASRNGRGGSARRAAAKGGGGGGDGVAGSTDEGDAPAKGEEKEEETAAEETAAEETVAEEIVDEPLDFASVGSEQEEGEGDGVEGGGDDGAAAGQEVVHEFDGQFV